MDRPEPRLQGVEERGKALEELRLEAQVCRSCSLSETRTQVVFGVGNPDAELVFVGEAPGFYEDKQGEPFVGAAGKLLDQLLGSIGLARADVYIANVLKCRPPSNRDPLPAEVERCEPYLGRQLELIKPRVVAALGRHAAALLLGKPIPISRLHGKAIRARGLVVFPLYHPAAALYQRANLEILEEDFRILGGLLAAPPEALAGSGERPDVASARGPAEKEEAGEPAQLSLFE